MSPDELRAREAQEWLAKANQDLASAKLLAEAGQGRDGLISLSANRRKELEGLAGLAGRAVSQNP